MMSRVEAVYDVKGRRPLMSEGEDVYDVKGRRPLMSEGEDVYDVMGRRPLMSEGEDMYDVKGRKYSSRVENEECGYRRDGLYSIKVSCHMLSLATGAP